MRDQIPHHSGLTPAGLHRRIIRQVLQGMDSCFQTGLHQKPPHFPSSFHLTLKGSQGVHPRTSQHLFASVGLNFL